MRRSDRNFTKIPDGKLGIIALEGCKELGKTIDNYIIQWRSETYKDFKDSVACDGYLRDTYLLDASCPRFGSGEAKGIIRESVRDMDLYIIFDVLNYSVTYSLSGRVNHMSPDDHTNLIATVDSKRYVIKNDFLSINFADMFNI